MKKYSAPILILILTVSIFYFGIIDKPKKGEITKTRLLIIENKLVKYILANRKPPSTIDQLGQRKNYDDSFNDEWGNQIRLKTTKIPNGWKYEVYSLGSDQIVSEDDLFCHGTALNREDAK